MQIYDQLTKIFDEFNQKLFEEILGDFVPDCIITLQHKSNMYAEMKPSSYIDLSSNNKVNEICINPQWFGVKPRIEILQYIAHQMVHVYQHAHGEPAGKGKHNEQFLDFMNAIGLMPSDTGMPGGKELGGKKVLNYPIPDGAFLKVANELAESKHLVSWFELDVPKGFNVNDLVKELFKTKELLDGLVDPTLLHVPLLISQNIDVDALLECLKVDDNQVTVDEVKASKLAETAIKEQRVITENKSWDDIRKREAQEVQEAMVSQPGEVDSLQSDHSEIDDNEQAIINDGFQIGQADADNYDDGTSGDAADIFLKKAMQNKLEKFENHAHPGQKKVVKSTSEIVSALGLSETSEPKKTVSKRDLKYTCSCGEVIKGGLNLNVICGKCQLHFYCETMDKDVDVVKD